MKIIYEDNHLIVLDKEAGMLTQGDHTGAPNLYDQVKEYIKDTCHKPGNVYLGMVHRLDRPVSGVILFARTSKAAGRLSGLFRERTVGKIYAAVVHDAPGIPEGVWMDREERIERRRGYSEIVENDEDRGKPARLRLLKAGSGDGKALFLVSLLTGKKHQIRAQLAAMGMPVAGDRRYGSPLTTGRDAICLHSFILSFVHPVSRETMVFTSPLPDRFFKTMPIDNRLLTVIETVARDELGRELGRGKGT